VSRLAEDLREALRKLERVASLLDARGDTQRALRVRIYAEEIQRLVSFELDKDRSE
jgi:hypothetical protein